MPGPKALLISGATGKQGGAVIRALLEDVTDPFPFKIYAVTRNANSASAQRLQSQSQHIHLIEGNLNNSSEIFDKISDKIWGVFSVQLPGKAGVEEAQGRSLIDAAVANGVDRFIYTSVDRGGTTKSDKDDTNVPHFATKARIERHLKDEAAKTGMNWTILRPTAFFDNMAPGVFGHVFGAMWATMPSDTKLQFVSTADIGRFAAKAFRDPGFASNEAVSLAGDSLSFAEADEIFEKVVGRPLPRTYTILGRALRWGVAEVGTMFTWFEEVGYGADIAECKRLNPAMQDFEMWIREQSGFIKS